MNLAWLDRFMLCEVNYPDAVVEKDLLVKLHPALPEHIVVKMVDFANEIRKQFIGASDSYTDTIEVTLSTRTLLRWADLTLRFQPLAHQGIQPLSYALDRAWAFGRPGPPAPCCMNFFSGCSRWIAIWGSKEASGNHAGAMADLHSQAYGDGPRLSRHASSASAGYSEKQASSRFWRGEAFSHALELLLDVLEGETEA